MTLEKNLTIQDYNLQSSGMIEASAGTGKTYTISNLALGYILGFNKAPKVKIEHLLVVTFTNAAASDLKARILGRIIECRKIFEKLESSEITVNDIKEENIQFLAREAASTKEHLKEAIAALTEAEHNIDNAPISTIHSFCNTVLNTVYSFDAGTPFNVSLSTDTKEYEERASTDVYRKLFYSNTHNFDIDRLQKIIGSDPCAFTKIMRDLKKARYLNDKEGYYGYAVKGILKDKPELLIHTVNEEEKQDIYLRLKYLLDLHAFINEKSGLAKRMMSVPNLVESAKSIQAILKDSKATAHDKENKIIPGALFDGVKVSLNKGNPEYLEQLDLCAENSEEDFLQKMFEFELTPSWTKNGTLWRANKTAVFSEESLVSQFIKGLKEFDEAIVPFRELFKVDNRSPKPKGSIVVEYEIRILIAVLMLRRYDELCLKDLVISQDDLLFRLAAAVSSNEDLRAKLRALYPVAMIDEFQDTDPVQYEIFSKLYLSEDAKAAGAVCFLIGDPKQSIYAFRGADINSYQAAKDQLQKLNSDDQVGRAYTLGTNYRSSKKIVEGVNSIFEDKNEDIPKDPSKQKEMYLPKSFDYEVVEEESSSKIEFKPAKSNDIDYEFSIEGMNESACNYVHEVSFEDCGGMPKAADFMQRIAKAAADDIELVLKKGKIKNTKGDKDSARRVISGDICVLVSKGSEAEAVREELNKKNIASVYFSDRGTILTRKIEDDFSGRVCSTVESQCILFLMDAMCNFGVVQKVNALLGCSLLGYGPKKFNAVINSDAAAQDVLSLESEISLLRECFEKWNNYGFIAAFNLFVAKHNLIKNILRRVNGERELATYVQIAELIQSQSLKIKGAYSQLRWFKKILSSIDEASNDDIDADQIKNRLETDHDLVKIYTIHMSKGLEFPLVFTPFLYKFEPNAIKNQFIFFNRATSHVTYGDCISKKDNSMRYDDWVFSDWTSGWTDDDLKRIKKTVKKPEGIFKKPAANADHQEKVRLAYVALTRAKLANFIYLNDVVELKNKPDKSALQKILTTVCCQDEEGDKQNPVTKKAVARAANKEGNKEDNKNSALSSNGLFYYFRDDLKDELVDEDMDTEECNDIPQKALDNDTTSALEPKKLHHQSMDDTFKITSYSGISNSQHLDVFGALATAEFDNSSIKFCELRGSNVGTFMHELMEEIINSTGDETILQKWLSDDGTKLASLVKQRGYFDSCFKRLYKKYPDFSIEGTLVPWLFDILNANLLPHKVEGSDHLKLSMIKGTESAAEMDYFMSVTESLFSIKEFSSICRDFYALVRENLKITQDTPQKDSIEDLNYKDFSGFVKGQIDLVTRFEDEGPYYLIDYKTNFLGRELKNYAPLNIAKSVFSSRYDVQILIYSLALHRFLKNTLTNYDPAQHFGGVMYLYLRGMGEDPDSGVLYIQKEVLFDSSYEGSKGKCIMDRLEDLFGKAGE